MCTFFRQKLTTPFLNQRKGENDRRKYFMINLHERILPTSAGVEPVTSWSPVRWRIQLSYRGRHSWVENVRNNAIPVLSEFEIVSLPAFSSSLASCRADDSRCSDLTCSISCSTRRWASATFGTCSGNPSPCKHKFYIIRKTNGNWSQRL